MSDLRSSHWEDLLVRRDSNTTSLLSSVFSCNCCCVGRYTSSVGACVMYGQGVHISQTHASTVLQKKILTLIRSDRICIDDNSIIGDRSDLPRSTSSQENRVVGVFSKMVFVSLSQISDCSGDKEQCPHKMEQPCSLCDSSQAIELCLTSI